MRAVVSSPPPPDANLAVRGVPPSSEGCRRCCLIGGVPTNGPVCPVRGRIRRVLPLGGGSCGVPPPSPPNIPRTAVSPCPVARAAPIANFPVAATALAAVLPASKTPWSRFLAPLPPCWASASSGWTSAAVKGANARSSLGASLGYASVPTFLPLIACGSAGTC